MTWFLQMNCRLCFYLESVKTMINLKQCEATLLSGKQIYWAEKLRNNILCRNS